MHPGSSFDVRVGKARAAEDRAVRIEGSPQAPVRLTDVSGGRKAGRRERVTSLGGRWFEAKVLDVHICS